ncbi:MAG: hypothetical protein C0609_10290 [Deltaproteobacteria bacterium]|nr:MAG: hypothetical protein C0609_10290 [Deltaproteobacteria bacterium]
MKGVVMAGGFGTRLQPMTHDVPKPMVPLANRPMMYQIIKQMKAAGIDDIVVLLYYMPEVITDYFGDGSKLGVKLTYIIPDEDLGTAGAVKSAEEYLGETFLVISGDIVSDLDLKKAIAFHRKKGGPITLTLTSVDNPLAFGVVITGPDGRIQRFLEKPGWGEVFSDTVNTGIYILEPEIFNRIPAGEFFDFSKDLFPIYMREEVPIFGYNAKGYWRDVGNTDSYREAANDILKGRVKFDIEGKVRKLREGTIYLDDPSVKRPAKVEIRGRVLLGEGAKIAKGATVENSVIGPGSKIKAGAKVVNSTIWKDSVVGEDAILDNVVLCDGVTLGKGVTIERGAVVASGVKVGARASFERDIMIWPGKEIERGALLSSNLVWGDKWKKSIFTGGMVTGETNTELSPEFAAKVGAALGTVLPPGNTVLVSRDYLRASRMLKRAFLGGLLSTGINVHDVKMTPVPVARLKLSTFGEEAGIHFQQSGVGAGQIQMTFFDDEGNLMDTGQSKSIERIFFKENFRRMPHDEVGEIVELTQVPNYYRESFLRALDPDAVRSRRFNVVIDFGNGTTGSYLPEILNSMGCRVVSLNSHPDERRLMRSTLERGESLEEVAKIVTTLGADAGFFISPGGEYLYVVDDLGRVYHSNITAMAILRLLTLTSGGAPVKTYLPVTQSRLLSEDKDLDITWGRSTAPHTSKLHDMDFIAHGEGRYAFPTFLHAPDAMFAAAKILELLSLAGKTLSEVYDSLPKWSYKRSMVRVDPARKGQVMRMMSEASEGLEREQIDGIQVKVDGAYILVIPDADQPTVHLVAQGPNEKRVIRVAEKYRKKIETWGGAK